MNRQQSVLSARIVPGARQQAARYAIIILGSAILAFGLYNIHSRSEISEGGVLGAMLLLEHWLGVSPSVTSFVLDGLCYLIGFKVLGLGFAKYSLAATTGFAVFYRIFESTGPLLPDLSAHPLLAAVLGGLFVGTGCGVIVRIGGAAGGDDAIALSVSKLAGWPVAKVYIISDMVILLASLSYIPVQKIGWSAVTVAISSATISVIQRIGREREQKSVAADA